MDFNYFYGRGADQFAFYQIPKILITDPEKEKAIMEALKHFGHTWRVCQYKKLVINLQFAKFFAKINEAFNHLENVKRYYI